MSLLFALHPFKWAVVMPAELRAPRPSALLVALSLAASATGVAAEPKSTAALVASRRGVVAEPGPPPRERAEEKRAEVRWSFHAGAPLAAPPTIAPDGSVLVVTIDRYLHALRADGSYRYSFTLPGRVVGGALAGPGALTVAAAAPNRLVAVDEEGGLAWSISVVGGIGAAPVLDERGRIWIATLGKTLLGFSARGALVAFSRLGPPPLAGPVPLARGGVAAAGADGIVRLARGPGTVRAVPAAGPVASLVGGQELYALGDFGLERFDPEQSDELWRRPGIERVVCTGSELVVVEKGRLQWLSVAGRPGARLELAGGAGAPMACLADGTVLAAFASGTLTRLGREGAAGEIIIPEGDVASLVATGSRELVVAYRSGRVVALAWT